MLAFHVVKQHRGYLTHQQVASLAVEVGRHGDVVLFLAYTGLRWGEMAALRARRVDLDRMRLDISEAVTEPRGVLVFGTPKSHERRSLPLPPVLTSVIERRLEGKAPDDLVFTGADGGVLRNGNFRNRWFDAAVQRFRDRESGSPSVTPHDLRHTAASLARLGRRERQGRAADARTRLGDDDP